MHLASRRCCVTFHLPMIVLTLTVESFQDLGGRQKTTATQCWLLQQQRATGLRCLLCGRKLDYEQFEEAAGAADFSKLRVAVALSQKRRCSKLRIQRCAR